MYLRVPGKIIVLYTGRYRQLNSVLYPNNHIHCTEVVKHNI